MNRFNPSGSPGSNPAVEAAAAEWLVRHDRGLTPAQQDEFLQWRAASPAHRESFERHRQMWRQFDGLSRWRPEHSAQPNPDLLARPRRARLVRWITPVLFAAAAGITVAIWRSAPVQSAAAPVLVYEATKYRQEILSDGTMVDMNRGSHVIVQYSPTERRVLLVQGEAQFSVFKNPARPFVVRSGAVEVRAVGTAFNVKLVDGSLEVLVTEGRVHITWPSAPSLLSGATAPVREQPPSLVAAVSAGERTIIPVVSGLTPPVVVPASTLEIAQLLEWTPRLLDFDSTPLTEVIAAFNLRNSTRLIIGDETLRELPIVASIRSDNVEGFVRLLEATMGVRAERTVPGVIVLRSAR